MSLASFHPAVRAWFESTFAGPTAPQVAGWPRIRAGEHTLIAAPTGSGKTLSAFLCAIDDLVARAVAGTLEDRTYVVYVSPLKALGNDIERNLERPLEGIRAELERRGTPMPPIRTAVRSGDTAASRRAAMSKRPPHILVTTPESLYILLTSEGGRRMLAGARTVIVDEIHALVRDKRGSHLALSLERLGALVGGPLQRIGLSATQRPIEEVARYLVGASAVADDVPRCAIVDEGHRRAIDVAIEIPGSPLETVMSHDTWAELYDRIAALVSAHRTTLLFVNTRRLCERAARLLAERLGDETVTSHHGSLAKEHRLAAEQRLKRGDLRVLVATSSLELGIDVGDVDLVCQIGSPRSIAGFLQRVGRSGHFQGGTPKGRLFPTSQDDLVECAALLDATRRGELDRVSIPEAALDILAQQIVAEVSTGPVDEEALFQRFRAAWPYRRLPRERFDAVVRMLAEGFSTRRGRRGAFLHRDAVNAKLRPRRHARISAITSGGAIPDAFDYEVRLEPTSTRVGTVNEDFAIESTAGDVFQLGNASYRIARVEPGIVHVEDAKGVPPSIPFWLGEAPSRTDELSRSVSRLRALVADAVDRGGIDAAESLARDDLGFAAPVAGALVEYIASGLRALGVVPTQKLLVAERFFDEVGGMHLVLHAPFGGRANRALGLALRKRFCRTFNVELQAAATEDALVLSLGPMHSFEVGSVFSFLRAATVRDVLVQALLDAPMFTTRWRWNATRALAILRFRSGKRVPPRFQRMDADDLLAVCFPDQVACLENIQGSRDVPDHPLVAQTIHDCLEEAMDIDALERLLRDLESGEVQWIARDLTEPSPFARHALNANPYAFLDDAPLEERRTQAVMARRWLDPSVAGDLGALDPAAIDAVREEAFPSPRDAEELHDALVLHGALTEREVIERGWEPFFDALADDRRAAKLRRPGTTTTVVVAAERLPEWGLVAAETVLEPRIEAPHGSVNPPSREAALTELVRGQLEALGPTTPGRIAARLGLSAGDVDVAIAALEAEGFLLRGRFDPRIAEDEVCDRRLLARIHRATLGALRRAIEPVSVADYVRFLVGWQRVHPDARADGPEGLRAVLDLLEGFEAAAAAWESDLLPVRMRGYDPSWLDHLCLSGRVAWARRSRPGIASRGGPVRTTPVALVARASLDGWLGVATDEDRQSLSSAASDVLALLDARGACFFDDLVGGTRMLATHVEAALGELVAGGWITSDGFVGLRALLAGNRRRGRRGVRHPYALEVAGRFSVLPRSRGGDAEQVARALLRRWGVVARPLLDRESALPPWRDLVRVLRRMELSGEVRGGRFLDGISGEQYALPDAVDELRRTRRREPDGALVSVSASDPLNLAGILFAGARVPTAPRNRLLFRDGILVAVREGGEVRVLDPAAAERPWDLRGALVRREVPPEVRAYLGNAT